MALLRDCPSSFNEGGKNISQFSGQGKTKREDGLTQREGGPFCIRKRGRAPSFRRRLRQGRGSTDVPRLFRAASVES